MIKSTMESSLRALRMELHANPEISGHEYGTSSIIEKFIHQNYPTKVTSRIGGTGLAALYAFGTEGPIILIRCELDALPIKETNNFAHRSKVEGVSHKCGHDGHMTIVAGLASWLKDHPFKMGSVILLFQPAEETGQGAQTVLKDPLFRTLKPDYVFALHNLPGFPIHSVIACETNFSATVQSLEIKLEGLESHAAEPEHGINPALAIAQIISAFAGFSLPEMGSHDFCLITPVHVQMGQRSLGISAGSGELHFTLRTWNENKMDELKLQLKGEIKRICDGTGLKFHLKWMDFFPPTKNHVECNSVVERAALENKLELIKRPFPFKFGEDFGWFTRRYKGAMYGIGAGLSHPPLHNPAYDFPDKLTMTGINMFKSIIQQILGSEDESNLLSDLTSEPTKDEKNK